MVKTARQLSIVIPGLFGSAHTSHLHETWQGLSLQALEGLLSRARRESANGKGLEQTLFALFGFTLIPGSDLPIAAVTRQWEAQDADGFWWLRADPVHLRADSDRIVMLGNQGLDISVEECSKIALELNRQFSDTDWILDAVNARRWYLRLEKDPHIVTEALPDVVGRDILHLMPQGSSERRWRSVMNEAQMVLHSSRINQEREARGALPINSLWFWGGGRLPSPSPVEWSQVWGNDALSKGLACLARVACSSLPADAAEWLADNTPGKHLLVLDGLREKVQFGDVVGWREFLNSLDSAWLQPLFAALKQGRLAILNLYPADGTAFSVTVGHARRWWVRRRSLEQWFA